MYLIGNQIRKVENEYVFEISKKIGTTIPKYVKVSFVHGNSKVPVNKFKILKIDKAKHIIVCENGNRFRYWDNCYFIVPV